MRVGHKKVLMRQIVSLLGNELCEIMHVDQGAVLVCKEHVKDLDLNCLLFFVVLGVRVRV